MEQLTFYEEPRRVSLKLDSVRPLLEYLYGLPQESCDRDLTTEEDKQACDVLLDLDLPFASRRLDDLILEYACPKNRTYRTLSVWYSIARSVAIVSQCDR